jgi:hypothetical protein
MGARRTYRAIHPCLSPGKSRQKDSSHATLDTSHARRALHALAGLAVALWLGSRSQQRVIARLGERLHCPASPAGGEAVLADIGDLPPPVQKYFRCVLKQKRAVIQRARFAQAGALRIDTKSSRWMKFTATQLVAPPVVGFLWNARVSVAPLLHIGVRDALIAGQGSGQVSLLSALLITAAGGNPQMNSGALHRYLAEAVWYPTALLPSAKLRWSAINDSSALATLTDSGISVSLEFRFNAAGEVAAIYTPARWGAFAGDYQQAAWEGHFRNYVERSGMLVPSYGEVGWYAEGTWQAVWKGTITEAAYEFAR